MGKTQILLAFPHAFVLPCENGRLVGGPAIRSSRRMHSENHLAVFASAEIFLSCLHRFFHASYAVGQPPRDARKPAERVGISEASLFCAVPQAAPAVSPEAGRTAPVGRGEFHSLHTV